MKESHDQTGDISKLFEFLAALHLFTMYTRIQDNIPGLNAFPWVGVLGLIVSLMGLRVLKKDHFSSFLGVIFWAAVWFSITGIGAISTVSFKITIEWGLYLFPQLVAIFTVYSRPGWPQKLLKLWVVIYFSISLITIKNGGTGPGSFIADENDLALALSMGFPLCIYICFMRELSSRWKAFSLITAGLIVVSIVLSSSRGGLLGFIAVVMAMAWLAERRAKLIFGGMLAAVFVGGVVLSMLPDAYIEDMRSISDTTDSTRVERLRTWEIGWEMFKDNPIMGIGAGNVPNTAHLYEAQTSWYDGNQRSLSGRQSHSVYFQAIPELGLLGIFVVIYILFWLPLKHIPIARKFSYRDDNLRKIYLNTLLASMAGFVSAGAFISVLYYPHLPVWLMMFAIYRSMTEKEELSKSVLETRYIVTNRS